jgi:hypothetical protein
MTYHEIALVKQSLLAAAETLRAFDEGDPYTDTGWKHDELCQAWKQCHEALVVIQEDYDSAYRRDMINAGRGHLLR